MKTVPFLVLAFFILFACDDGDNDPTDGKFVEKTIVASTGGSLTTSESIELYIPPDALPVDGKVLLGQIGDEPTSVPNKNIKIVGKPITIQFPSESILKPVQLSIPIASGSVDTVKNFVILFNGSTYFPVEYSIKGDEIVVSIDIIDWESTGNKGVKLAGDIIVYLAIEAQSVNLEEMGLKRVTFNSVTGGMNFSTPTSCPSSKILLLVHGWSSSPVSCWNGFLNKIMQDKNSPYSEYWTFGYNSSWSINNNGKELSILLSEYAVGNQIDIVAHSMGGLVSRSMIEKFNGASKIRKLITLGTPHEGSPLAVFRYALGARVVMDDPLLISTYNYYTQGFRDLYVTSDLIAEMMVRSHNPLPYYTIAAINDPFLFISSAILPGDDDGIVTVKSAHGNYYPTNSWNINIPVGLAHTAMTLNESIYNRVVTILMVPKDSIRDIDYNYYKIAQIGSQTWMLENLKTARYNNGNPIGTTIPATLDISGETTPKYQWAYNGDENSVATYGRLYTWYAAADSRNVCPTGWHLPSNNDWAILLDYLTMNRYGYECSGNLIAKSMAAKELWTQHAESGTIGNDLHSNNSSGFSALPGGGRFGSGPFGYIGYYGCWWSSSEYSDTTAYHEALDYNRKYTYFHEDPKENALSVRCVKN